MKCKRKKAAFGADDAAIVGLILSAIGAATSTGIQLKQAAVNRDNELLKQRYDNMSESAKNSQLFAGNLQSFYNNQDAVQQRKNDLVLPTLNNSQFKYGGRKKVQDKIDAPRDNTRVGFNNTPRHLDKIDEEIASRNKDIRLDDGLLGFAPIIGDVLQGAQGIIDIKNKKYKSGLINLGLLAVPNVIDKTGKTVGKIIKNKSKYNKVLRRYVNNGVDHKFRLDNIRYEDMPEDVLYRYDYLQNRAKELELEGYSLDVKNPTEEIKNKQAMFMHELLSTDKEIDKIENAYKIPFFNRPKLAPVNENEIPFMFGGSHKYKIKRK